MADSMNKFVVIKSNFGNLSAVSADNLSLCGCRHPSIL